MLISRAQRWVSFWFIFLKERTCTSAALKKLKTASVPKFKKKGNEKQFLLNSEVLEHVHSASTALQASSPQVEKALEELKEGENKLSQRGGKS